MTTIFKDINGFKVVPFSYENSWTNGNPAISFHDRYESLSGWGEKNSEWIEITKEKNKLPRVVLRSYVLYYRNNGNDMSTTAPGVTDSVNANENYRFYNDFSSLVINSSNTGFTNDITVWSGGANAANGTYIDVSANQTSGSGELVAGPPYIGPKFKIHVNSGSIQYIHITQSAKYYKSGDTITIPKLWDSNQSAGELVITLKDDNVVDSNGRQLGWIWGFPLFNVSTNNWPRFNSCIGGAGDISGNQKMLVDISAKQNLIVLDMSKFQKSANTAPNYGDGFKDISNNIPGQVDNFYMVLRIKNSAEKKIPYDGTTYSGQNGQLTQGKDGNWNPFGASQNTSQGGSGYWQREDKRWCTLVQYEFYCDIIYPTPLLDFTPNYFTVTKNNNSSNMENRLLKVTSSKEYISYTCDQQDNINKYTETITMRIKTGLNKNSVSDQDTMSPGYIVRSLSLISTVNNLDKNYWTKTFSTKEAWYTQGNANAYENGVTSRTIIRLIGGWVWNGWSSNPTTRDIGYYGTIIDPGGDRTTRYAETKGWKNDISLNNTGSSNVWPSSDTSNTKNYDLNTVLWCSLRSPRKLNIKYHGNSAVLLNTSRYITNFIDLKDSQQNPNIAVGGGYSRSANTLDLPRGTHNAYFSAKNDAGTSINSNTVSIISFNTSNDFNYLDASSNTPYQQGDNNLSLNQVQYYRVYYKLLIPPEANKEYSITYNFGRDDNCVTTFFRHTDMSGVPYNGTVIPTNIGEKKSKDARRDDESIVLKWDNTTSNGDIAIKSIEFIDIASGNKNVTANISSDSDHLNDASHNEVYDLSFNVFQLHFFSKNTSGITDILRNENPYTLKTFDTNINAQQFVDISYVPQNFVPYRFINLAEYQGSNYEQLFVAPSSILDCSGGLAISNTETIHYNPGKVFTKDVNDIRNADIIDPSATGIFPTKNIIISNNTIVDNSYSVLPATLTLQAVENNQGQEIATFDSQRILNAAGTGPEIFTNSITEFSVAAFSSSGSSSNIKFLPPNMLELNSYLIPDYWRLPDKINVLRTGADDDNPNSFDSYQYYNAWTAQLQTTMVFDILSIALKAQGGNVDGNQVGHILVNTNKSKRGSTEYSAVTESGKLLNNSVTNIVFDVQGAFGVPPSDYLNLKPIVLELQANFNGPYGTIGQNYIGNRSTGSGGINVPYPANSGLSANNSKFVVNTIFVDTLRKGNNTLSNNNLGSNNKSYNGLYDINAVAETAGVPAQNPSFAGTIVAPSPIVTFLVDISQAVQSNPNQFDMLNDENNLVTLEWSGFDFNVDPSWNLSTGNIFWTITRYNISSGKNDILISNKTIMYSNNRYTFQDTTPIIYSKYRYTVSGIFKWMGITSYISNSEIPTLNVPGFTTNDIIVCKYNRFQYGRYNSTSTNLKLFRPLLLNTTQGQVDQFGNKVAGGLCEDPNQPGVSLLRTGNRISSSNNIYASTTNQVSKKQTYVILSKARFRPFR